MMGFFAFLIGMGLFLKLILKVNLFGLKMIILVVTQVQGNCSDICTPA